MKQWLRRFMIGRYGQDNLNKFIFAAAVAAMVVSVFIGRTWLYPLALVLLILCLFRMLSKNGVRRVRENAVYLRLCGKIAKQVRNRKSRFQQRKTHRFYKCPKCKVWVRVPKGRGRLLITCTKCNTSFEKKT